MSVGAFVTNRLLWLLPWIMWVGAMELAVPVPEACAQVATDADDELRRAGLIRINAGLEAWLQAIEADVPYLLLDREQGVLRLQQGHAVLRSCPTLRDSAGRAPPARQVLSRHLRRYRRSHPYALPQPGPFDWDYYLVGEATAECAIAFSDGLLLHASDVWRQTRAPFVEIEPDDVRALYNAVRADTPLITLPAGWSRTGAAR